MEPSTERAVSKPLVYRKERKYALANTDLGWVETIVRSHPSMFCRPFPARYINNIYQEIYILFKLKIRLKFYINNNYFIV